MDKDKQDFPAACFKGCMGAKAGNIGYTRGGGCPTLVAGQETHVVYCLQGNGIDRDDKHGCNGKGYTGGGIVHIEYD